MDFWGDLAQVFKENLKSNHPGSRNRIFLDTLREFTFHLYRCWMEQLCEIRQRKGSVVFQQSEKEDNSSVEFDREKHLVLSKADECMRGC
jgi:hypothetical protein